MGEGGTFWISKNFEEGLSFFHFKGGWGVHIGGLAKIG